MRIFMAPLPFHYCFMLLYFIHARLRQAFFALTLFLGSSIVAHAAMTTPPLCAEYDGSNLFIAANDGNGTEMCYWFKRCMANELFTFYRVGQRTVGRNTSDTEGISKSTGITWLNKTASDNIGPVGIKGYPDFVGGNHRWRNRDENGNFISGYSNVRTAQCDSVIVKLDGLPLNTKMNGQQVLVTVWNTLFDPLVAPENGNSTTLTSPIINEQVEYRIQDNSINVVLEHKYLKDFVVSTYYGMQSMCNGEDSIMTPSGKFSAFTAVANCNGGFKKKDYNDFNRYTEHTPNGWCQSAWMRPKWLGTHQFIGDNSNIFWRGSGKCYHWLMKDSQVSAGQTHQWNGIYTWALPLVNDPDLIAYRGIIDQQEALYIDTKQACDRTLPLPDNWKGYYLIESKGEGSITRSGNSIHISATGQAGMILTEWNGNDAINDIKASNTINNKWYTLNGICISKPQQPGLYIHNGSKIAIVK